ncbi:MAG: T9SS type A sorting domain-containing protein [Bacteroidia bacterium]
MHSDGNLNPNNTQVWADYPTIGISNSDLFVSTNMFDSNGDFQSVGLFQMSLADGYAGSSLNSQSYIIGGNAFTVVPVNDESDQPDDKFYLVSRGNRTSQAGRNIVFYEVNGALANGGTLQGGVTLQARFSYSPAPPMAQNRSTVTLSPGDSRINNAFRRGSNLYFAFPTNVNSHSAIYWGSLKLAPLGINFSRLSTTVYTSDSLEFAFPSVCWAGDSDGDEHSNFIFFNYSGADFLPGTGVIYVNTNGEFSDPLLCSESDLPAPGGNDPTQPRRWGDYTDISYQAGGVAWGLMTTILPTTVRRPLPARFRFRRSAPLMQARAPCCLSPWLSAPIRHLTVPCSAFEVPNTGYYKVEILDMHGKVIQLVIEDRLIRGKAELAFDTQHMATGMYFVRVTGESNELMRGKFVVE